MLTNSLRHRDFSQLRICRARPSLVRSGHNYMKDAHSAESNEKLIFRFLFFELWLKVQAADTYAWIFKCVTDQKKIVQKWSKLQKRCTMS